MKDKADPAFVAKVGARVTPDSSLVEMSQGAELSKASTGMPGCPGAFMGNSPMRPSRPGAIGWWTWEAIRLKRSGSNAHTTAKGEHHEKVFA